MSDIKEADEELTDVIRAEISHLTELRRSILEQHSHSFKWITASLLAINGGAAAAALNNDSISPIWKVASGSAFSVGVLLALVVAVLAQKISVRSLVPIQRQIGYWIGVIHDGTKVEEFEEQLAAEMKVALKWGWTIPATGWVSGLFFAVGLAMMTVGILDQSRAAPNGKGISVSRDHSSCGNDRRP